MSIFQSALPQVNRFEFPIGETSSRELIKADLTQINHLLVAGASGSGKSVFIDAMLLTLIFHNTPDTLRLLLCDTKASEFHQYRNIQHLLAPVCTAEQTILRALEWALREGDRRLHAFSETSVKNLVAFNDQSWENFSTEMPRILIVIDDLSMVLALHPDLPNIVRRLLSIGRTVGIHIIGVTQTPAAKESKAISSLFTSRMVFQSLPSDLRFATGKKSPQSLENAGDAWYCSMAHQLFVHSFFPDRTEIFDILETVAVESKAYELIAPKLGEETFFPPLESEPAGDQDGGETDELLPAAVEVVLETEQASVSMLQRRLKLGYSRAARLVDQMEQKGYVGPFEGSKPRQILLTRDAWAKINAVPCDGETIQEEKMQHSDEVEPSDHQSPTTIELDSVIEELNHALQEQKK